MSDDEVLADAMSSVITPIQSDAYWVAQAKAQAELQRFNPRYIFPPAGLTGPVFVEVNCINKLHDRVARVTAENERLADELALAQAAVRLLQDHLDAMSAMVLQAKAENAGQCGPGKSGQLASASAGAADVAVGGFPLRALRSRAQPIGLVTPHG
jgi:hypothetical protein